jgi:hypothetical protein
MLPEPIAVTLQVVEVLDALGVPYLIGGSFASSVYGTYRATADVDLVADLKFEHVEPLVTALREQFYIDTELVRDAIRHRRSFSAIHLTTMFKVDVFIPQRRPYSQAQLERRVKRIIWPEPECTAYLASAEDNILAKMEWYRMGGEVSDRQWRDILGVLKVQGDRLDLGYLRRWAADLSVADLLEKALAQDLAKSS